MKKLLNLLSISTLSVNILPILNLSENIKTNHLFSEIKDKETGIKVKVKAIFKFQTASKGGQVFWINKKDVMSDSTTPSFFWNAVNGLNGDEGSDITVQDDSVWEKIGSIYGFSNSASDDEIYQKINTKKIINVTFTIDKYTNFGQTSFYLKDFSAKYTPVNLNEVIPKEDYYDKNRKTYIYKNNQEININNDYLSSAILDGKILTIPLKNIGLNSGSHFLKLTLKEKYKDSAILYDGNNSNGEISINYLIKNSIDQKEINFKTTQDDTDLLTGLTSNSGNTNNSPIIQTKAKDGSGVHNANLDIIIDSDLIDLNKSYYILGTIENNDFTSIGKKLKISSDFKINTDGIYKFYLEDVVGNIYSSYLELGENNWKLTGTFSDTDLTNLSEKLNVSVNLTNPNDKQIAMAWLQNYQNDSDKSLNKAVKELGKGFNRLGVKLI